MVQEIGRLYIEQRIKTLENNVDVPQDILTQLLKIASKLKTYTLCYIKLQSYPIL